MSLENDLKALEECRRKIHSLQIEEASIRESETKLKSSLSLLRKGFHRNVYEGAEYYWVSSFTGVADSEREMDELRLNSERERRLLSDLGTHKAMLESELGRLAQEVRFNSERNLQDNVKRKEIEVFRQSTISTFFHLFSHYSYRHRF